MLKMLKLYPYGDKSSNLQTPFVPSSLQNIFRSSKGSKDMYTILNKNSSFPFNFFQEIISSQNIVVYSKLKSM
jgi:hypothetical protein